MKRLVSALSLLIIAAIILSGCTFARQKINVEGFHEKAENIIPGTTEGKELHYILGSSPNAILPLAEGKTIYLYSFGDGKSLGLNLILFQIQKTNIGFDTGYFVVDEDDIVREKVVSTNSLDVPWQWWAFGD